MARSVGLTGWPSIDSDMDPAVVDEPIRTRSSDRTSPSRTFSAGLFSFPARLIVFGAVDVVLKVSDAWK
ncbi:hypothetical protein [Paenibacillus allorhizoplanae]|uniref:hypothetical protein n=1 Tax=Paenibacillus allorhizoplanae TaxID=2905648 RepID=UPI001F33670F|nr:hypothetical protein [Paenibacillus allorhizoplanae]